MRRTCSLWPTDARATWAGDMVGPAYFPGKITMHYFGRAPTSDLAPHARPHRLHSRRCAQTRAEASARRASRVLAHTMTR